jgi:hypothetical protein
MYQRQIEAEAKRLEKAAAARYTQTRERQAEAATRELATREKRLRNLLSTALARKPRLDFNALKQVSDLPNFDSVGLSGSGTAPVRLEYLPPPLNVFATIVPWLVAKHNREMELPR